MDWAMAGRWTVGLVILGVFMVALYRRVAREEEQLELEQEQGHSGMAGHIERQVQRSGEHPAVPDDSSDCAEEGGWNAA